MVNMNYWDLSHFYTSTPLNLSTLKHNSLWPNTFNSTQLCLNAKTCYALWRRSNKTDTTLSEQVRWGYMISFVVNQTPLIIFCVIAGVCWASGDPHYRSFDGRVYSFMGQCNYILAKEKSGLFSITSENVPCGSTGITCTKSVTASVSGVKFHLVQGSSIRVNNVTLDSTSQSTLPSQPTVTWTYLGAFTVLNFPDLKLTLMWDGGTVKKESVLTSWIEKVRIQNSSSNAPTHSYFQQPVSTYLSTRHTKENLKACAGISMDKAQTIFRRLATVSSHQWLKSLAIPGRRVARVLMYLKSSQTLSTRVLKILQGVTGPWHSAALSSLARSLRNAEKSLTTSWTSMTTACLTLAREHICLF